MPKGTEFTIQDIENLPEEIRAELIAGNIFIQPTPLRIHQKLTGLLQYCILQHMNRTDHKCDVYARPLAVYLGNDYVEPDLSIICNPDKLTEKGCKGAPEWIVEVSSQSTAMNDYVRKLALYAHAGVHSYWIVDPERRIIRTYLFTDHDLQTSEYTFEDSVPVALCDGFSICISNLLEMHG